MELQNKKMTNDEFYTLQKEILTQTLRYGRMNWKNYKNN